MRVAFFDYVGNPARPGTTGLSDEVWDVARRLARLGEDVHVVAPYTTDDVPDRTVRVHRFPIPQPGYRNLLGHLLIILAGCRRLRELGPWDVIHTPEYTSSAVITALLPGTPLVFTEPGNIFERVARGNPYDPITTLAYKLAARRTAATCAQMIATSAEMAHWWRRTGVAQERISRVPLGIDTTLFQRVPGARARLGWTDEEPAVLYAARLSRENGVDVALRAMARLRERGVPAQFHVLGSGPERARLAALAASLGMADKTVWHGWVDLGTLPLYYSAADVFVFSGHSGGTPRVLLQAMSCGAPVIASAIGGIVDHVEHGRTGLLFPAGDYERLATALEQLSQPGVLRRLGEAGRAYTRQVVDWDLLVARIREDVYPRAIAHKRAER